MLEFSRMYPNMQLDSLHGNKNSVADYPELRIQICMQVQAVRLDNALHLNCVVRHNFPAGMRIQCGSMHVVWWAACYKDVNGAGKQVASPWYVLQTELGVSLQSCHARVKKHPFPTVQV